MRADKQAFMEDLATKAEDEAHQGEQGNMSRITKLVCGKYRGRTSAPIKDKHRQLLSTEKDQEARWTEHFREVLNRLPLEEAADIQETEEELDINIDPPEKEEISAAISSLKNGKAPGPDNLDAEFFKADPELAATILQPLFVAI